VYRFKETTGLGYLYSRSDEGDKTWGGSRNSRERKYKTILHEKITTLIKAKKEDKAELFEASIVVIDDLNLGFREYRPPTDQHAKGEQILSFLRANPHFDDRNGQRDGFIVWRMEYPLAKGDLWDAVIDGGYADRTILILSGENLREDGIDMRDEDPLEQKVYTLHHLLAHSSLANKLSKCNRIIIRFNNGVLQCINRKADDHNIITAYYHPLVDGKTMDGSHDLGRMIGYTHVLTAAVVKGIACAMQYRSFEEFDCQLMPSLNDMSEIPTKGKNLIIVAAVKNVLHFRIFEGDDKVFVDTDEEKLTRQTRQIDNLKKQLVNYWPPHELANSEKAWVITAVTAIVRHTSFEERLDSCISAGLRLGVVLGYRLFENGFGYFDLKNWDELEKDLGKKWQAGEVPRPLERVFWEWDRENRDRERDENNKGDISNRCTDEHVITLHFCDLPRDFINYTSRRNRQRQPWNRVDDYCAQFADTSVSDAPETAATAIVLHGVERISERTCESVYEEMHKEGWKRKEVKDVIPEEYAKLDRSIQVKIDAIKQIRTKATKQLMPNWAPKTNIFLPYVTFGEIKSIDREEIVGLFSIKSLMENYRMHKEWVRPLSIAVFGPPGSGKSFSIRQVLSTVDPEAAKRPKVEFNLAQFSSVADLETAFHQVQDQALQVQDQALADVTPTPMIVFDEFDTNFHNELLGWLHLFLMPMQDGLFKARDHTYRIGRVIFVFTGGTFATFDEFYNTCMGKTLPTGAKGPDFISRLRGHLDIKKIDCDDSEDEVSDLLMFRRAILLRSLLEQNLASIIDKNTGYTRMDRDVIRAFLMIPRYKHGVRSMEAIIQMARISRTRPSFQKASLPPPDQLDMHVDADQFHERVYGYPRFKD